MPNIDWKTVVATLVILAVLGMVVPKLRNRVTGA